MLAFAIVGVGALVMRDQRRVASLASHAQGRRQDRFMK